MSMEPREIKTYSAKYKRIIELTVKAIRSNYKIKVKYKDKKDLKDLEAYGIVTIIGDYAIFHKDELIKSTFVVNDDLYAKMTDVDWLREQRKKLGLIEGKIKTDAFRKRQNAKRKAKREFANKKRAELKALPPEELPLTKILLEETPQIDLDIDL